MQGLVDAAEDLSSRECRSYGPWFLFYVGFYTHCGPTDLGESRHGLARSVRTPPTQSSAHGRSRVNAADDGRTQAPRQLLPGKQAGTWRIAISIAIIHQVFVEARSTGPRQACLYPSGFSRKPHRSWPFAACSRRVADANLTTLLPPGLLLRRIQTPFSSDGTRGGSGFQTMGCGHSSGTTPCYPLQYGVFGRQVVCS